ncbi:YkvA family protein [Zunongwangia sp. H14]|uniref:YkvA family protein n=1 Tax=Zunongwangia sp. H14 TaxID=3240792 RepID=UPI003562B30D
MQNFKRWAKDLRDKMVLAHLVSIHPWTPWYPKIILLVTLAYALSPIDLVPDFIPVLGLLDDLLLVPLGIWLSFKLIPKRIIEECARKTADFTWHKKKNILAAIIIVVFWLGLFLWLFLRYRERLLSPLASYPV